MKKALLILSALLLVFCFSSCIEYDPENDKNQATPTYIDEVRYNFNILFDKMNQISEILISKSYDFETDSLGYKTRYAELVDIGKLMPTVDDYITVSNLYSIEKKVNEVTEKIAELKANAESYGE